MNPLALIDKYYPEENELKHILLTHSRSVADKALAMARNHPELNLDLVFVEEAAMLHDIGISGRIRMEFIVLARILIFVMDIWDQNLWLLKVFRNMLWCANVIQEPVFPCKVFWNRIYRFRIVRWCRSVWKNRLFVLLINSFPKRN